MEMLYKADLCDGTYRNPILYADFSDPDVVRDGDRYYMTASSFNYTPGLPILRSYDLVNWELLNYALENVPGERFDIPRHSEGVWAPSIRKHGDRFYIFFGMPDEGIFMTSASDPLGKWTDPVCLLKGKGLIDPCPIWDDDGRAYVVHAYAKSRIGFKSILGLFEMKPDGTEALSRDRFIFDGNDPAHTAVTIEGPKFYKRDGYYYILAPAGGVPEGYQLALRSRDIYGPYEMKKILDTGDTGVNGPHQGALIDAPDGSEWFIHFNDEGMYGRITYLEPVVWKDGWPVAGNDRTGEGWGEPVSVYKKPVSEIKTEPVYLQSSDEFEGGVYGLQWQWLGNHRSSFTGECEKGLRLKALNITGEEKPSLYRSSNVLTQKMVCPSFTSDTEVDIRGLKNGSRAGVLVNGGSFISLYVTVEDDEMRICLEQDGTVIREDLFPRAEKVGFRIACDKGVRFYFRSGDGGYTDTGRSFSPSEDHWTGSKTGIYALSAGEPDGGYADFKYFRTVATDTGAGDQS
ncbi:MAG: glycoside hydrolase 43 family protein [Lachnospiraceae bacterium]|nr:glycoside hydrolase 43 family protein [Lachnospiraceae bacterium]